MITIDTREAQDQIIALIQSDKFLWERVKDFEFKKLNLGDYLIERTDGSTLLIERKTISDFSQSLYGESGNGTFRSKLMRMGPLADEHGLLIEGDYIKGDDGLLYFYEANGRMRATIKYSQFKAFLYHRQQENVMIFTTRTLLDTLYQLLLLYDDKGSSPALKVVDWTNFLILLPGIGKVGVEKIKKKYLSPMDAFMDIENWPRSTMRVGMKSDVW